MDNLEVTMKQQLEELTAAITNLTVVVHAALLTAPNQAGFGAPKSPHIVESPETAAFVAPQGPHPSLLLPSIDGCDPLGWLARANQQFEIHQTPPEQKVPSAMVVMKGGALHWFTWVQQKKPNMGWAEFSQALMVRFDTQYKGGVKKTNFQENDSTLISSKSTESNGITHTETEETMSDAKYPKKAKFDHKFDTGAMSKTKSHDLSGQEPVKLKVKPEYEEAQQVPNMVRLDDPYSGKPYKHRQQFPEFRLGNKAVFKGGGIVMKQIRAEEKKNHI